MEKNLGCGNIWGFLIKTVDLKNLLSFTVVTNRNNIAICLQL